MALVRRASAACVAVCALAAVALADPAPSGTPDAAAATQVIESLNAAQLEVMKQGKQLGFAGRVEKLRPAVMSTYDFEFIAEKSVGLAWKDFDAEQRAKLTDAIARLAVATYAARMADFGGERFETIGTEPAGQETILVHSRIFDPKGTPIAIDYRLRSTAQGPRIVDVFYDGTVSELAMRRSEYSSLLKKGGLPALLEALEKKTADQATAKPPKV